MRLYYFTFIIILSLYKSIRLLANPEKKTHHCVYKQINSGETISLSYVISGAYYLDNCNSYLYDPDNELIYHHYNDQSGKLEIFKTTKTGLYKLCFKPLSNARMHINFDFHTLSEIGELRELAKDENFKEISKEMNTINNILEKIHQNVKFITEKRNEHATLIENIIASVKNITYTKGFIIVFISIIQIYFITKLFSNRGNSKVIIRNERNDMNVYL